MQKQAEDPPFTRRWDGIHFLIAVLHHHPGFALLGLALMLPLLGVGRGLGVPYLYWHDNFGDQLIVGGTVGLAYWHFGFVAYVLVAAQPGVLRDHGDEENSSQRESSEALRYVCRATGPLLVVVVAAAVTLASCCAETFQPHRSPPYYGIPFILGLGLSFSFVLLTLTGMRRVDKTLAWIGEFAFATAAKRFDWIQALSRWLMGYEQDDYLTELGKAYKRREHVFGMMIFFSLLTSAGWIVLSVFACVDLERFGRHVPAAVSYCVALALTASILCLLRTFAQRLTLLAILVTLIFGGRQLVCYPHDVAMSSNCAPKDKKCEAAWRKKRSLYDVRTGPPATELVDDDQALCNMIGGRFANGRCEHEPDTKKVQPVVIITTSGGGIRSAGWTVAVFAQLEAMDPELFSRVRLITGASGGMVGASHWIAERMVAGLDVDEVYARATASSLYAPLSDLVLISPLRNRGEALEQAWEFAAPELKTPLHDFAERERAGTLPSLVFAPLLVEDGSQMLMSNLDLKWYAHADGWDFDNNSCEYEQFFVSKGGCGNARQFFARVPSETVKLSTLARISASFPYVSPAVTLPFVETPRAVDAGYYDNYGIKLAVEWIIRHTYRCPEQYSSCLSTQPILLVELRDHEPDQKVSKSPLWQGSTHELMSPIQGFLGARVHVANHRNAAIVDELERELGDRFEHVVVHFDGQATLGWELTKEECRRIWAEAVDARASGELKTKLEPWWRAHKFSDADERPTQPSCE